MPMQGIEQPELIQVGPGLRLRKYDGRHDFALAWYRDPDSVYLIDGNREPYTPERLNRMYEYLNARGELYFIEVMLDGTFRPAGDVTLWQDDMPIVIGEKALRGRGIGRQVIRALSERARALGWTHVRVGEIYDFNEASRRCFEAEGFVPCARTEKGHSYILRF